MSAIRETILSSIFSGDGQLEDGIFPTGCIGYSKENQSWLTYDPDEARKLLADAGYAEGFDLRDVPADHCKMNFAQKIRRCPGPKPARR